MLKDKNNNVITIFGNTVNKKDCISIGGEYYQKNIDCFNIDGRWYRKGNPRIYFDDIKKEWRKVTANVIEGVIGYDENSFSYEFGKFEKEFESDYFIETVYGRVTICNKDLFDRIPKIFSEYHGLFYDYKYAYSMNLDINKGGRGNSYIYSFERMYNSENLIDRFSQVDNSKYTENLIFKSESDIINKYSFGFEFETSAGVIPEYKCKQLGLIPLRDGSISGHEYTTIPMKGMDGINLLANQLKEIKNSCSIDRNCSVHLHLGGFPLDENKIIKLYNLCYSLQNEIGELFPYYVFNTSRYKSNGKDYCKKLPRSVDSIDDLYSFLSDGHSDWGGSFIDPHPSDPRRDRKWEVHSRYYYCNFINMLFGDKIKTVEFRIHNATTNIDKIVNWLYICIAILNYAENGTPMKSITLKDIVEFSYKDETSAILMDYISKRKEYNKMCFNKLGDSYGYFDLMDDKSMSFKTPVN